MVNILKGDSNSPIFIACRPTGIIAILFWCVIALMLSGNANAADLVINGDLETGDSTGWVTSGTSPTHSEVVTEGCAYSGTYGAGVSSSGGLATSGYSYFNQTIDLTNVNNITLWYKVVTYSVGYISQASFSVFLDGEDEFLLETSTTEWTYLDFDVSGYSGDHLLTISCGGSAGDHPSAGFSCAGYFDDVVVEVSDSVEWNQSSYYVGETGLISYDIGGYDPGTYDYSIDIFKDTSFMGYCHLNSDSGNASYEFSDVDEPVTYYAKLTKRVNGTSTPMVIVTDSCTVNPADVSILFNQSVYGPDEMISISYYNCPNGSKIILQDDIMPHDVSYTWDDISGNGSVSYQLSNADASRVFYTKVYSSSDAVLASDYMQIDDISSGYCQIYGGIYDSQDYHPLIGTVFIGSSYSDVVAYDDYGVYSIIVPWGTYDLSAVVSSYLPYNMSNVAISGLYYNLNMYMSVNYTTTSVFRGSITDAVTNAAIDDVFVKVWNDTASDTDFSSQSGVWVMIGLTSGLNYSLYASKDGYHPYSYYFEYDPGDFYHNFAMSPIVPVDEDEVEVEDVLEEDESMTDYFNEKFREFAPTAWGFFILMSVMYLMSIFVSFGGNKKR